MAGKPKRYCKVCGIIEVTNGKRVCETCKLTHRKEYNKKYLKKYYQENKEKLQNQKKEYIKNNLEKNREYKRKNYYLYKEKVAKRKKEDREKRPEIYRERLNKYNREHKWRNAWRNLLRHTIEYFNTKKDNNTIKLLGYSALELKNYIENLFTIGMNWNNYGEWHIDHIKPVYTFDKNTHPSIINALSNLRPLWATTRTIDGIVYEGNLNRLKINK